MTWLREQRSTLAAENILDAATQLFVDRGVSAVGMGDVARAAGCSRQTLYRYFDSRQDLHLAFAHREAVRLVSLVSQEVTSISDPGERLVATIVALLREVRSADHLAAWFRDGESSLTAKIANSSPMIESLALSFFAGPPSERAIQLTRWCIRVTMSLLITPGADVEDERRSLQLFVAPLVKAGAVA
ncbi:TetR/AcrR family transcriptional regulator [Aeromicrobium panaciterrae]|uniref:TetR/AcrR family transcriptional regulator n=1 Tax=Aeromicrobium panaciterrae TaxID=363861 RepID=UPI0031DEE1A7